MTTKEQLIEQHIREYESRLRHIDELCERAHQATEHLDEEHDTRSELKHYEHQLIQQLQKKKKKKKKGNPMEVEHWREETIRNSGPMAIWDILAQRLEDFIERHE